jgi:hypothetical protein
MEVANDEGIKQMLDDTFINEAVGLFQQMHENLIAAHERVG